MLLSECLSYEHPCLFKRVCCVVFYIYILYNMYDRIGFNQKGRLLYVEMANRG
jgi:hypothetical protein